MAIDGGAGFSAGGIRATAELDLTRFRAALAESLAGLQQLDAAMQGVRAARINLDTGNLRQQTEAAKAQFADVKKAGDTPIRPKVDTAEVERASREFSTLRLRVADLANPTGALSASFGQLGVGASAAAIASVAALAAISVGAVKTAGDLQAAVASVKAIQPSIDTEQVTRALNDMQTRVAQSSEQLARSLYNIFSSIDVSQAQALELLEQFARGAVAAETDAQTFGTAVIGVLNAYKLSTADASRVSDIFFNTVKAGVVTGAELAQGLGPVTAAAKAAGVSFETLGALVAGVTREGGPAAQNINNLTNILVKLAAPETTLQLARLHIPLVDQAGNLRDIIDILTDLKAVLDTLPKGEQASVLAQIFPDIQARQAAQTIISQLDFVNQQLAVNRQQTNSTAEAYTTLAATARANAQIFGQTWSALLEELGASVLPGLTELAKGATGVLQGIRTEVQRAQAELGPFITALETAARRAAELRQGQAGGGEPEGAFSGPGPTGVGGQAAERLGLKGLGQRLADETIDEYLREVQRHAADPALGSDAFQRLILSIFAPERLAAALATATAPGFDKLITLAEQGGAEAAAAFGGGFARTDLRDATERLLAEQGVAIDAFLGFLERRGINGGALLLQGFERGIQGQSPELFQQLADLKERMAAELAQGADTTALRASFQEAIRATFGDVPPQIVDQMWAQISGRSEALALEAGQRSGQELGKGIGEGAAEGVQAALQRIPETLDAIQRAVRLQPNLPELTLKSSVDPEDIERILRWKQANEQATQAISGLTDKTTAARAQAALNNDELERGRQIALEAAASQQVLQDRYQQIASAALPALSAQQAELVRQFQLANDPARAAAVAVQLVGGNAAEAAQALSGTGADFARYVQQLQRIADTADPVTRGHRQIEDSARKAVETILQGLPVADRAWEEYRAAREGDAAALERLAGRVGIDPAQVRAALAGTAQDLADFQARLERIAQTADPVARGNKLIQDSAREMLQSLEKGLPAADRAWLDYVAAREGDRQTLRALYARMGGDLDEFDAATEAKQRRLVDLLARQQAAIEQFASTGVLAPAPTIPREARGFPAPDVNALGGNLPDAQREFRVAIQDAQDEFRKAMANIAEQLRAADIAFIKEVGGTFTRLGEIVREEGTIPKARRAATDALAQAIAAADATLGDAQAKAAETLAQLAAQAAKINADFSRERFRADRSFGEQQADSLEQYQKQRASLVQQLEESTAQTSLTIGDAIDSAAKRVQEVFQQVSRGAADAAAAIRAQLEGKINLLFAPQFPAGEQRQADPATALAAQQQAAQAALQRNLDIAERARQQQALLDAAQRARGEIDKQVQALQSETAKTVERTARDAAKQRDEQLRALRELDVNFAKQQDRAVRAFEESREDAFRALSDALAANRAARDAALKQLEAAQRQHDETIRRGLEQHVETLAQLRHQEDEVRAQHQETVQHLQHEEDEARHRFFELTTKATLQLNAAYRQIGLLEEIAAKEKPPIEQNNDFHDIIVVEPATQFLELASERWQRRLTETVG